MGGGQYRIRTVLRLSRSIVAGVSRDVFGETVPGGCDKRGVLRCVSGWSCGMVPGVLVRRSRDGLGMVAVPVGIKHFFFKNETLLIDF